MSAAAGSRTAAAAPGPADSPVVLPVGRHGLLVELPGAEAAEAFHAEVLRRRAAGLLPGITEIVPGARTVLWDADREPAALFAPGTRVRFVPEDGTE